MNQKDDVYSGIVFFLYIAKNRILLMGPIEKETEYVIILTFGGKGRREYTHIQEELWQNQATSGSMA